MKHEYKTTRIWIETLRKLKRIAAETGETIVSLIDRLADAELQRVQQADRGDLHERQETDAGPG